MREFAMNDASWLDVAEKAEKLGLRLSAMEGVYLMPDGDEVDLRWEPYLILADIENGQYNKGDQNEK